MVAEEMDKEIEINRDIIKLRLVLGKVTAAIISVYTM